MLFVGATQAQTGGVVNLQANQTSGTGSLTPVLTWSTSPAAVSCQASGGWSGTKAASGTQTLPAISTTTNYTLTCSWGGDSARLSWNAPATNTNGTVLSDLTGFRVVYGTSATALNQSQSINDVTARTATVSALTPGTWYFAVRAVSAQQRESADSNVAQKTVTAATAARTVTITMAATPPPPPQPPPPVQTLKTTSTHVYDVIRRSGYSRPGVVVGQIDIGKPCDKTFTVGNGYYRVSRSDVRFTRKSRSQTVIALCASS